MKFTITYEYDPTYWPQRPYWAKAEGIARSGITFGEAKESLMKDLNEKVHPTVVTPPPEEVEIL